MVNTLRAKASSNYSVNYTINAEVITQGQLTTGIVSIYSSPSPLDINLNTIAEVEGEENKEDTFIEEGVKEFGFAASVTQSVKKGSTQEVRLMLATLPDVEKHSRYFGEKFKTLAPTELVWKKLEDALVGLGEDQISDSGVTTMEQRMIDAVREAGEAYPPLKVLADRLSSPNMPPHKKIGFFSTFSKARNNYRTALSTEEEDGWSFKLIDSDSQKASSLLMKKWNKEFLAKNLSSLYES